VRSEGVIAASFKPEVRVRPKKRGEGGFQHESIGKRGGGGYPAGRRRAFCGGPGKLLSVLCRSKGVWGEGKAVVEGLGV